MSYSGPVIEVHNVYKSFKTVKAVCGVDLRIPAGQFVALLGPNGAGKTTLVEMIEGIQKPDTGSISIMGKQWRGNEDELHRIIGLSLQETYFIDRLTVWETLALFASFYELGTPRISEIIDIVGLKEKTQSYTASLSGGQRQRLALGIALLNHPKILLLDEPTTGLDPNARREIWDILLNLKDHNQASLILTTHYMEEAQHLCDYIVIIDKGRILKEGTLNQLLDDDNDETIIEFSLESEIPDIEAVIAQSPFKLKRIPGGRSGKISIRLIEADLHGFLYFIKQKNLKLKNLEFRKKTLDDLFTSMTGRKLHE